jgi:hypothetical protein
MATPESTSSGEEKVESICSHCGASRKVPSKYIGKKVKCRECEQPYRIEDPSSTDADESSVQEEPAVEEKVAPRKKRAKGNQAATMVRKYEDEVNPDDLLKDFRARPFVAIGLLTLILHVVILGGSSFGFIQEEFLSEHEELPEEERERLALDDATLAIKEISEKYNLKPDQITGMFSSGGSRGDKLADKEPSKATGASGKAPPEGGASGQKTEPDSSEESADGSSDEKSDFQQKLEKVENGPEEFTFEDEF